MAINPDDITTARVGQLPPAAFNLTDLIPHEVGTVLSQGTIQSFADFLAAYIDTTGTVAFRPVTVLDGQTLPDTTELEWILVGKGTFINVNGGADITTTEELNALMSNGTYWFIGVEIPIEVEGIGYTPESIANKISEITNYSEILYPNEKAVHDLADTKLNITDLPSNLTLYPTTTASAIGGYFKMVTSPDDPDFDETAIDVSTGSITTTAQLISSLVAPAGTIIGQPGIINITTIGNIRRVSGSGTADFYFELYHRNLAGTETFIGVSNPTMPITNSVYGQFSTTAVWNDGTFLETDTIVIKYYANRIAGGVNPVYEFQFGGLTPVRSIVPVAFNVLAGDYELKENKQNALTADGTGVKYPTVDAVRNEALLLSGTTVGNPVTGDIELTIGAKIYTDGGLEGVVSLTLDEGSGILYYTKYDFSENRYFYTGATGLKIFDNNPTSKGLSAVQDFSPNITNLDYTQKIYVDSGLASKADKQGTILYHSVKWFTPSSSVSNVGAIVTSIGTQFTSAMVGSILRINNEDRLIITYTSSTVVVVDVAYSTNYSGVVAGSWGVYSVIENIVNGFLTTYNPQKIVNNTSFLNVSTYSDLLLISPETHLIIIKVLNDENKGIENTIYYLYPDGTRMWIAAVED